MRTFARTLTLAAVPLALLTATAAPAAAEPPEPVRGTPACNGLMVANNNHFYGWLSPSGNENASVGPGTFFAPHTSRKIHADRGVYC